MKIRNKIAVWIVGAGLCGSLIFSAIVFIAVGEEYYELIDTELRGKAVDFEQIGVSADSVQGFVRAVESLPSLRRCWLSLYDVEKKSVWKSAVANDIDIALPGSPKPFTVLSRIPTGHRYPDLGVNESLAIRAMSTAIHINGAALTLLVGIPIENPVEEIIELSIVIAVGFVLSATVLTVLGFWLSGRILKPISDINRLASVINEKTLSRRIPLGRTPDELYRLAETLNSMFDRLQYSFEKQKQFVADASHELKSPVALLRLKTEEYLQSEDLPEEHRASLLGLSETLHRMSRLINDLLDLSILEHPTTPIECMEISLNELLLPVLDDFAEAFAAKQLVVHNEISSEVKVFADIDKFRRVLVNLVDNAIKYNKKDGMVKISGHATSTHVFLSIGNTGPGIPEADLENIFDQFYRLEKSRSMLFGGVGLGLTITRRIIELHGGKIDAESIPGQWTQMNISLPSG